MCVYLHTKLQVSRIILKSFKQREGVNVTSSSTKRAPKKTILSIKVNANVNMTDPLNLVSTL